MDRNLASSALLAAAVSSLSARRAWIEMSVTSFSNFLRAVALRKESVDRNSLVAAAAALLPGRSPQGERG